MPSSPPPPPPSVSSSYKDLMPQFLRAIRMLCALHSSLLDTNNTLTRSQKSSVPSSLPGSPASLGASPEIGSHVTANVRRAGSFGSILDSPVARTERRSVLRFGHRRSNSSSNNDTDSRSSPTSEVKVQTLPCKQRKESSISDPFQPLETVWDSLECWFDLVNAEVDRLQAQEVKVTIGFIIMH